MHRNPSPTISALITLSLSVIVYFANDFYAGTWSFYALTIIMLYYLCRETRRVRQASEYLWLLNPAVLCSILTFVLPFGIGNFIHLLPEANSNQVGLSSSISPAMTKIMMLVLLAAASMWTGYWSKIANILECKLEKTPLVIRLIRVQFVPNFSIIIICLVVIICARLILIQFGAYGFNADAVSLANTASVRQYFTILEMLSKFILIVVALHFYSSQSSDRVTKTLLIIIVIIEISFGFLSGFKSAVAIPFVIVGLCYYYRNNRLNIKHIFISFILLLLAYAVIEPFRVARHTNKDFTNTSLISISNTLISAASEGTGSGSNEEASTLMSIMGRMSLAYIASLGIEYKDAEKSSDNSPAFLRDIFLAPLYAVIPRFLWSGKELSRHGQWYSQEVMGIHESGTSVGMSSFTYLYFAGGWIAVCIGFFFVGIVQRITLALMEHGGVVYLAILPNLISIDSVYYTFILDTLRTIPLTGLFFIILYRRISTLNCAHLQHT